MNARDCTRLTLPARIGLLSAAVLMGVVLFSPRAHATVTDHGTLLAGSHSTICFPFSGDFFTIGYRGTTGAYSPTGLTGGKTVGGLIDYISRGYCGEMWRPTQAYLWVEGFSSDPGTGWLTSVTCNNVTRLPGTATYTYESAAGRAIWYWPDQPFGFTRGSTSACSIEHN
jgi:hypothetical protein